jgi:tRNA 2-selenouridine synthase SelU
MNSSAEKLESNLRMEESEAAEQKVLLNQSAKKTPHVLYATKRDIGQTSVPKEMAQTSDKVNAFFVEAPVIR